MDIFIDTEEEGLGGDGAADDEMEEISDRSKSLSSLSIPPLDRHIERPVFFFFLEANMCVRWLRAEKKKDRARVILCVEYVIFLGE